MALNQCKRCGQFRGASHRCLPKHARKPAAPTVSRVGAPQPPASVSGAGSAGGNYLSSYEKFQTRVPTSMAANGAPGAGYRSLSGRGSGLLSAPQDDGAGGSGGRLSAALGATEQARVVLSTPHPESGAPFRPSRAAPAIDSVVDSVLRPSGVSGDRVGVPGRGYSAMVFSPDTRRKAAGVAQRANGGPAGPSVPDFFAYNRETRGYHYLKPDVASFLQQAHREASAHERGVQQRSVGSAAGVRGSVRVSAAA